MTASLAAAALLDNSVLFNYSEVGNTVQWPRKVTRTPSSLRNEPYGGYFLQKTERGSVIDFGNGFYVFDMVKPREVIRQTEAWGMEEREGTENELLFHYAPE